MAHYKRLRELREDNNYTKKKFPLLYNATADYILGLPDEPHPIAKQ